MIFELAKFVVIKPPLHITSIAWRVAPQPDREGHEQDTGNHSDWDLGRHSSVYCVCNAEANKLASYRLSHSLDHAVVMYVDPFQLKLS